MRIDSAFPALKACAVVLAFVAIVARPAVGQTADKVTICHIPPGNPANAHTISVGADAVPAHLGHGDTLTACEICLGEGERCGGPNGNCCGGTMCNAGMCVVPACLPNGAMCGPAGTPCCAGLSCDPTLAFCTPPPL